MPKMSQIRVTFVDGEVRDFRVSAGAGIIHYLTREAHDTGMVVFRDDVAGASTAIPVGQIRTMSLTELPSEDPS